MKALFSIAASAVLLIGCATNTNQSLTEEGKSYSWAVKEDLRQVYSTYRSYARTELEFYVPVGGGMQSDSDFFPSTDEAEVWVRAVGNPLTNATYLLLQLSRADNDTLVTCNAYNNAWLDRCGEFEELLASSRR